MHDLPFYYFFSLSHMPFLADRYLPKVVKQFNCVSWEVLFTKGKQSYNLMFPIIIFCYSQLNVGGWKKVVKPVVVDEINMIELNV